MRNISRGATHVERNNLVEIGNLAGFNRADDTSSRPRQNTVLALKLTGIRKSAVRLHKHQSNAIQFTGNLIDVVLQNRGKVGVDDRCIAASDQLHQWTDLVRGRDLCVPDLVCDFCGRFLVFMIAIAMQENDRTSTDSGIVYLFQTSVDCITIEFNQYITGDAVALINFDDLVVEQIGQIYSPGKQVRTSLVPDSQ